MTAVFFILIVIQVGFTGVLILNHIDASTEKILEALKKKE